MRSYSSIFFCIAFGLLATVREVSAQSPSPVLVPPRVLEAASPDPSVVAEAGQFVELTVSVAIDGSVREAASSDPAADPELARVAIDAVQRSRFAPATRNGTPIPARIRFRYVFQGPAVPDDAGTPLPTEDPYATPDAGAEPLGTSPDAGVPPAVDASVAPADGASPPEEPAVQVDSSQRFGARARVRAQPREATVRTIEGEQLLRIPGTRGDPIRAIEILPGVGRPPGLLGALLVRGAAPGDSQVFLDGIPVPLLYHFGGLTSFINGRLLDRISFYPGNFSVRYGRKIGGVLEVEVREPREDGYHGVLDVNLIDASAVAEGPIGDVGSFALAARRSYIDFFFSNVIPRGTFDVLAAPVYYDYQAISSFRVGTADRLRFSVYGSSDRFNVILGNPASGDPSVRGNLDLSTQFHRVQAAWRHRYSTELEHRVDVSVGITDLQFALGQNLRFALNTWGIFGRAEWIARASENIRLTAGLDIQIQPTTIDFLGPPSTQSEGAPPSGPLSTLGSVSTQTSVVAYRPGAYLEADFRLLPTVQLLMGVRLDWFRDIQEWAVDPRGVVRWTAIPSTVIKAGVGGFSQPPEFQESAPGIGNPQLQPIHALHVTAGVEHRFSEEVEVGVEGFYKAISSRVVSGPTGGFENNGIGRIYGLEVSGKVLPRGPFSGFLSYTLSRSERSDRGGPWRLFDFDQTHILTIAASYKLGDGWEVGATFRLVTGNPYTPVAGTVLDANSGLYRAIYGDVNSARSDMFHRLDVRVEKQWTFTDWKLAVYLDVQNVYNQMNPEGRTYNFDFRQSAITPGLPIIPSLGLRGEL